MQDSEYTVVATTYNDEDAIGRLVNEICEQTLPPKEIIIVDGGSTDHTVSIVSDVKKEINIPLHIFYGKRLNISEGYNEAIRNSSTDFIGIVGVGNHYEKCFFEKLFSRIKDKDLDGAYSPIRGANANKFSKMYNYSFLNGEDGQCSTIASNHGVLLKKNIFIQENFFYEGFIYAGEDTEFYTIVRDKGYKLEIVNEAFLWWETPQNMNEFLKQIKVYTIASIQIDPIAHYKNIKCRSLLLLFTILAGLFLFWAIMKSKLWFLRFVTCVPVLLLFIACKKKRKNVLYFIREFYQIYYSVIFSRYKDSKYVVRRNK